MKDWMGRQKRRSAGFFLVFLLLLAPLAAADELGQIRLQVEARGQQWVAGETSVSRLAPIERRRLLGLIRPVATGEEKILALGPPILGLPLNLDWRNRGGNFVTPVRNQGSCGSCWAFAATAALEAGTLIAQNTPGVDLNLAEQVLVSCSDPDGCGGGSIGSASNYIQTQGLPLESCYPYTATNGSCANACANWQASSYRITDWNYVTTTSASTETIKNALLNSGPLVTTMDVYDDFYHYRSGIYVRTSDAYEGGHAVLLVGYDDAGQYFIVKNSWGTNWGESGFFRIAYSELNSPTDFGQWTIAYDLPESCTYAITPNQQPFSASGGTGSVSVSAGQGCMWGSFSQVSWVTVTSQSSGYGNGTMNYAVAANGENGSRSGALTIAGQTFTVNQSGLVNTAPAVYSQQTTTAKNRPKEVTLTAGDPDLGDILTYTLLSLPAHGTLSGTPPQVQYRPALNYIGPDSFTFRANDGRADSNVATVSIAVDYPGAKVGVYRNGVWYSDENGNRGWEGCGTDRCLEGFGGLAGDIPVLGDWNILGQAALGVYRKGQWFLDANANGVWNGCGTDTCIAAFGGADVDKPVAGDWNGDGKSKIGIYRNGAWFLDLNGNGVWNGCGTDACVAVFGGMEVDKPVVGDWNGDGKSKIGIYRNGAWFLDLNGNGVWDGCGTDACIAAFGGADVDKPVAGDWNGDGKSKIGIYRNGAWFLDLSGNGAWDGCGVDACINAFGGLSADLPIIFY